MKTKTSFILIYLMFQVYIQAQSVSVEYVDIKDPFTGYTTPIDIGILDFEGSNIIEEQLYTSMKDNTKLMTKFRIYPFRTLDENKGVLGLNSLDSKSSSVQRKLLNNFGIKFLFSGKYIFEDLTLSITETQTGNIVFKDEFKKTNSSSAISDFLKMLESNKKPTYILKGELTLSIYPTDAEVYIDSKRISNKMGIQLIEGKHSVKISKVGYKPIEEDIIISGTKKLTKSYSLRETKAVLSLTVEPKDADLGIYEGYKLIKKWKGNLVQEKLRPGKYTIECTKKGYKKKKREIILKEDEVLNTEIYLEKETPKLVTKLNLKVWPSTSKVIVKSNGKFILSTKGNINNLEVKPGSYTIEISSEGYKSTTKYIKVNKGISENLDITLSKIKVKEVTQTFRSNSKDSVLLKSLVIPGWGQTSTGRDIGWVYTIGTLGSVAYYFVNLGKHNENVDIYNSANEQYQLSGSNEDYNKYTKAYDDMKGSYNTSNILLGAAIGIYAFNLLDALVFTPNKTNNKIVFRPHSEINKHGDLFVGLSLGIRL